MKPRSASKIVFAALIGFAFSTIGGQAQRLDDVARSTASAGSLNGSEGAEIGSSFSPAGAHIRTVGAPGVVFDSTISPTDYITSVSVIIETDFDNNGFSGIGSRILPREFSGPAFTRHLPFDYMAAANGDVGLVFDGVTAISDTQLEFLAMPVPEPSTFALVAVLALGAIVTLRRHRAASLSAAPPLVA